MKTAFLALALLPALFPSLSAKEPQKNQPPGKQSEAAGEKAPTDFLRAHEDEDGTYLQTALTSYRKGELQVDLIGAVHIADAAYYQKLNKEFTKYPVVLFEMVGGENINKIPAQKPAQNAHAAEQKTSALAFLGKSYTAAADFLQLADQRQGIDYHAKNLVHADLTLAEFQKLQDAKGETLFGTLLKGSLKAKLKPQPKPPGTFQVLLGIFKKEPGRVKKELLPTLAHGDESSRDLFGDSVIIADRNAKCLQVLKAQIAGGEKKIAVFYGAAHFPDLEAALLKQGFTKGKQRWFNAWTIPKKHAAAPTPAHPDARPTGNAE